MKKISILFSIVLSFNFTAQSYQDSLIELRVIHMGELIDTANKILNQVEIDHFEGLAYFEIDTAYRVEAVLIKSKGKKFKMPTSTDRLPVYRRYGYADFEIEGKSLRLTIYQNMGLIKQKEYKKYLFIPFRDSTSGNQSYGGGRYMDLQIPSDKTIILDFNCAYNPYCVYSDRYSCPIPPAENTLSVPIKAGEKLPVGYDASH